MKYKKKKPTPKQYAIERKIHKDTQTTNQWLRESGLGVKNIHVGTPEVFQALKLAYKAIKQHAYLLSDEQLQTLYQFVVDARRVDKRLKMPQGRCYKVMNITKQAIRKAAQYR